jgi:shikimate dehydrogenase
VPKQVVLIGHPVAQSLSGVLQQGLFDELGIDAQYELRDTLLIDLPDVIASLRGDEYLGANVAYPYKDRVLTMVDRLAEEAHATGAIDTITREATRLVGHNTDVVGFRVALDALVGRQKMPKTAVILGAGGGARAAVYALITGGFQRVVVFNRHLHRAEGLVRHFARSAAHMELRALPWHESVIEAELAKTKVLINASNSPDAGNVSPIPAELLPPELMVLDLTYVPRETRLLRDAAAASAVSALNGDLMLIHQTAAAFGLWTGRKDDSIIDLLTSKLDESRGTDAESKPMAEPAAVAE